MCLTVDQWSGSRVLSCIRTVGGLPHPRRTPALDRVGQLVLGFPKDAFPYSGSFASSVIPANGKSTSVLGVLRLL